jgi:hypothetical protein
MLREAAFDDFVEPVILVALQEAKATDSLATMANLPCGIDGGFAVVDALSVAERDEGLVSVVVAGVLQWERSQRSSSCGVISAAGREPKALRTIWALLM